MTYHTLSGLLAVTEKQQHRIWNGAVDGFLWLYRVFRYGFTNADLLAHHAMLLYYLGWVLGLMVFLLLLVFIRVILTGLFGR